MINSSGANIFQHLSDPGKISGANTSSFFAGPQGFGGNSSGLSDNLHYPEGRRLANLKVSSDKKK